MQTTKLVLFALGDVMKSKQSSRRAARIVALLALPLMAAACGTAPCPKGSMRIDDSCAPTKPAGSLRGQDAGEDAEVHGAFVDAAMGEDAATLQPTIDAGSGDHDAAVVATDGGDADASDAAEPSCRPAYVRVNGGCVRDFCMQLPSEPPPCVENATCTGGLTATRSCACNAGFIELDGACVDDPCQPAVCGANTDCTHDEQGAAVCSCSPSYGDCNAKAADGCELSTKSDTKNCGECGLACATNIVCSDDVCVARLASMSGGHFSSCGIAQSSDVWCWGSTPIADSTTPGVKAGVPKAASISTGVDHACVVHEDKAGITCWGSNANYQLGTNDTSATSFTMALPNVRAVAAGQKVTCAVSGSPGTVECWGDGTSGMLGDGDLHSSGATKFTLLTAIMPNVPSDADLIDVSVGGTMACVLDAGGRVYCWGKVGTTPYAPREVVESSYYALLDDAKALHVGMFGGHACATRMDDSLVCWGDNALGQLTGSTLPAAPYYYRATGVKHVRSFALGSGHTCAAQTDGTLQCWGSHARGQLGIKALASGESDIITSPRKVMILNGASRVYAGSAHTFVIAKDGAIFGFGTNYYGQMGNAGAGSSYNPAPLELTGWP